MTRAVRKGWAWAKANAVPEEGFLGWARHRATWLFVGCLGAWLVININAGPGVTVVAREEAEGPQFSDPGTLDLVTEVRRRQVCPSQTQRWAWRWITYKGRRAQQAVPLEATQMPFLAEDGTLVLTIPATGIPDPQAGGWLYRTVTSEQCSFLPVWFSGMFGARVYRSPDMPVNFVGAPHEREARR